MDITFGDSDIVDQNEDILIHLFFHIVDYDFRNGMFTDESSIHDMGTCGFSDNDYLTLAEEYNHTCPDNFTYSQGQDFYQKLSNEKFDNMVIDKFQKTYGLSIDKKIHYLKDMILLLKDKFPERNWASDNIFILKTLDNRIDKEEQLIKEEMNQKDDKVIKFPIRKKATPEDIKNGYNEYLMVKELGLTWTDAKKLAKANFDKKMEGKKFEPYIPKSVENKTKLKL